MPRAGTGGPGPGIRGADRRRGRAGQQTPMPGPVAIGRRLVELLSDPFYVRGTNDQGIGIQIAYSLLPSAWASALPRCRDPLGHFSDLSTP